MEKYKVEALTQNNQKQEKIIYATNIRNAENEFRNKYPYSHHVKIKLISGKLPIEFEKFIGKFKK